MKKHILRLDDSYAEMTCVAIISPFLDFEVAFAINSALGICLERIPDHALQTPSDSEYSFSAFTYDDEDRMVNWYLISNRSHSLPPNDYQVSDGSFFKHLQTDTQIYLIPDYKTIDYWLTMDCECNDFNFIYNQLKNIPVVSSVISFDLKKTKYWSNLLLH